MLPFCIAQCSLPYNHSMEICSIWKCGAASAEVGAGVFRAGLDISSQNQNCQICQVRADFVFAPAIFLFQYGGAVFVLGSNLI